MFRIVSLLEKSKAFTDRAFAAMPGAIFSVDKAFRILRANNDGANLMGETIDAVVGMPISSLFFAEDYKMIERSLNQMFRGEINSFELEAQRQKEDGRTFHWQFRLFVVGNQPDQAIVNVIGRDITELKQVMRARMELQKDLDLASSTQLLLLPEKDLVSGKGWRLAAHFEPAVKAAGDWWGYEVRADGSVVIFLGDVTGHGVASAMVTAMVLGCYKSLLQFNPKIEIDVFMSEFDGLLSRLLDGKYWMTLSVLDIHPDRGYFDWYSAAAPELIVISADGSVEKLGDSSRPLGSGELIFKKGRHDFKAGDRILCPTDGVYELDQNVNKSQVKREILKILRSSDSALQIREDIKNKLAELRNGRPIHDDTTFVVVEALD